jgi:hypothetical protein
MFPTREKKCRYNPKSKRLSTSALLNRTRLIEPVQLAFSVIDDQEREEIVAGEIPYTYDLLEIPIDPLQSTAKSLTTSPESSE